MAFLDHFFDLPQTCHTCWVHWRDKKSEFYLFEILTPLRVMTKKPILGQKWRCGPPPCIVTWRIRYGEHHVEIRTGCRGYSEQFWQIKKFPQIWPPFSPPLVFGQTYVLARRLPYVQRIFNFFPASNRGILGLYDCKTKIVPSRKLSRYGKFCQIFTYKSIKNTHLSQVASYINGATNFFS